LGVAIAEIRRERGVSQAALAEMCGLSRVHVQNIEGGLINPTVLSIWALAEALQIEVALLYKFNPPAEHEQAKRPVRARKRNQQD